MKNFNFLFLLVLLVSSQVEARFFTGDVGRILGGKVTASEDVTMGIVPLSGSSYDGNIITAVTAIISGTNVPITFYRGSLPESPTSTRDYRGLVGVFVGHYGSLFDGWTAFGNAEGDACYEYDVDSFARMGKTRGSELIKNTKARGCNGELSWGIIYINLDGPNLASSSNLEEDITTTITHEFMHLLGHGDFSCTDGLKKSIMYNLNCALLTRELSPFDVEVISRSYELK